MRYLVLSDIHSSIEALEACIRRAKQAGYDAAVCCGDLVGYGPNPIEVLDLLAELNVVSIRGNHDRAAASQDEPAYFNVAAAQAIEWTRRTLPEIYRQRLADLPVGPLRISEQAQLVHGSARDEDEYVVTQGNAGLQLALTTTAITFFGHTHEAVVFTREARWTPSYAPDGSARLRLPSENALVNPGSVGQPRDGDSRASFLIWDSGESTLEFYRVKYPFEITQEKMRQARLPELLIVRLAVGR